MSVRHAEAEWKGDLKGGIGQVKLGSGAYEGTYSFHSRFENGRGANPEELIGAAYAGCFAMALSNTLAQGGHVPKSVHATANVHLGKDDKGFLVTKIEMTVDADIPGLDNHTFQKEVQNQSQNCIIARALGAVPKSVLSATLK